MITCDEPCPCETLKSTCAKVYLSTDLDNVQPRIDNKPPRFNINVYYRPRMLESHGKTVRELDRKNFDLIKKLNVIHRMGGHVDCWNLNIKYKPPLEDKKALVNKITNENRMLMEKIERVRGYYCTADFLLDYEKNKKPSLMSSKSTLRNKSTSTLRSKTKLSPSLKEISASGKIRDLTRPRCYFEIEVENEHRKLGKIIIQLFSDVVPKTCENFLSYCRDVNGLSYKGTPFHRILPNYWCQGGDVTKFNGSGGTSIYGDTFEDENFEMQHSGPGFLSTCSYSKNSNDSKFNLTFKKLETMDGKKVVFGRVISGFNTLREIERFGTKNGRPTDRILVSRCGVL